ncbi:YdcF family protein [Aerosakkonemataceae cyanobacterium BLCC-F154]|uniref:YdcF family protein n=1 Tax=Floridaenema fluviatile BLCC-F154 TaxID=3153640 RepID=A0ABV4Y9D8_9CYAN
MVSIVWQIQSKEYRFLKLAIISFLVVLISFIPVRMAIAYIQSPQPQAILTLGSWLDREVFTAQFATKHPRLEIWVSSGTSPHISSPIFREFGIPENRVNLDYRAVDTVTNFTTLISDFKIRKIQHLYLITSDYHLHRAKAIATLILGSQGIIFTPISVPSHEPSESWFRILRDICRSLLWIFTGRTGASFHSQF